jgi:hypothetical protein
MNLAWNAASVHYAKHSIFADVLGDSSMSLINLSDPREVKCMFCSEKRSVQTLWLANQLRQRK